MRPLLPLALLTLAAACLAPAQPAMFPHPRPLPEPTPEHLPRWRGFNLLNLFHRDWSNEPWVEADFSRIARLGFNFVRIPADYRIWAADDEGRTFHENQLQRLDEAVELGRRHGVHVMINFHRAPGYTVNSPAEPRPIWSHDDVLETCARHWAELARRFRGVPNRNLSFNLFNEPADVSGEDHARVVRRLLAAIRAEDPDRLVVLDGIDWGRTPAPGLDDAHVAHATRGYAPFGLSHWGADWIEGSSAWPQPAWPDARTNALLFGPVKQDLRRPLVLEGPVGGRTLRLRVGQVSALARLVATADGAVVLDETFRPGPGDGPWKSAQYRAEWDIWQNVYDIDVRGAIPAGATRLEIDVTEGDWMTFLELGLGNPDGTESVLASGGAEWAVREGSVRFDPDASPVWRTPTVLDRAWLAAAFQPWRERAQVAGVMVGEFGANRNVPHDVVIRWMEDNLHVWRDAGSGWALWQFRGNFGVADSDRPDAEYIEWEGLRLDRAMIELLQRY